MEIINKNNLSITNEELEKLYLIYYDNVSSDDIKYVKSLSLKEIITNKLLNIIYIFDIELFVLIINWLFFYFYYRGGQINNFFIHNYWNIFIKSYFSYALVSGPVILYTFYENETFIVVTISIRHSKSI